MKILWFSRGYTTHDRRFLAELAASPHKVWYLRLENGAARYETRPVPDGVRELAVLGGGEPLAKPGQWAPLAPLLEKVLRKVKPDIVHAGPIQSCAFLAALTGFHPLLAMSWGSDLLVDAERDESSLQVTRFTLERAEMVFSDCAEVTAAAARLASVGRERILQFPWGVDTALFRPGTDTLGLRGRPGWENARVVISTRSWEPDYGVMYLLEGFLQARARLPELRLALLGDGSQRPNVECFLRENGLEAQVLLAGPMPAERLPDYFRAADIYASCAFSDGSSLSLLEAMATGLPVLATERASNREWIASNDQGRLVPYGNSAAISEALVELAELPAGERRAMGARNRAVVEERADWKQNIAKLLRAYEALRR